MFSRPRRLPSNHTPKAAPTTPTGSPQHWVCSLIPPAPARPAFMSFPSLHRSPPSVISDSDVRPAGGNASTPFSCGC